LIGRDHTEVQAFGIDKLDLGNADIPIGARAFLNGGIGFEWSANGRILLDNFGPQASTYPRPACGREQCRDRSREVNSMPRRRNHLLSAFGESDL